MAELLIPLGAPQLRAMMLGDGPIGFALSNTLSPQTGPVVFISDDERFGHVSLILRNNTAKEVNLTTGSKLSVHLTALLDEAEVARIIVESGWERTATAGTLELRPSAALVWKAGLELTIPLHRVLTAKEAGSANCRFECAGFGDLPEGGRRVTVFRQRPPQYSKTPPLAFAFGARNDYFSTGNTIYVTPWPITELARGVSNHFILQLVNASDKAIEKTAGSNPKFVVSFTSVASGDAPAALCMDEQLKVAACAMQQGPEREPWQVSKDISGEVAIWTLKPAAAATKVFDGSALVGFKFSDIVSQSVSESGSPMFIQYLGIPGYDDGYTALVLQKAAPMPFVRSCGAYAGDRLLPFDAAVGFRQAITIRWDVFAADGCRLTGFDGKLPAASTRIVNPDKELVTWTLLPEAGSRPGQPWTLQLKVVRPTVEMKATPPAVAPDNNVTISWKSMDGVEAFLHGPGIDHVAVALSGSRVVNITDHTTYTVICTGAGTGSGSVVVAVPPVEASIFARRSKTMLHVSWSTRYANSCTVKRDFAVMSTQLAGEAAFEIGTSWDEYVPTTTFTIEATGKGNVTRKSTA